MKKATRKNAEFIVFYTVLSVFVITVIAFIACIPTISTAVHTKKYENAIQANVLEERELSNALTDELNSAGIEAENAYIAFNKNLPIGMACQINGKTEFFSFKEVNLTNPIQFDTNEWAFVNPA